MIKKGDFVKVDYTGYLDDGSVFDTTHEEEAKKANIHRPRTKYGPALMVVGSGRMIPGLEKAVDGMEIGAEKETALGPDEAFGPRNPELISVVPLTQFEREKISPAPGMVVTIDERDGVIKSVGGGRVIVDFNHPLAGQTVKYKIKAVAILEKTIEKAKALMDDLGIAGEAAAEGDVITFTTKADPSHEYTGRKYVLLMNVKDLLPDIKSVRFNEEYKIAEKKSKVPEAEKAEEKPEE